MAGYLVPRQQPVYTFETWLPGQLEQQRREARILRHHLPGWRCWPDVPQPLGPDSHAWQWNAVKAPQDTPVEVCERMPGRVRRLLCRQLYDACVAADEAARRAA